MRRERRPRRLSRRALGGRRRHRRADERRHRLVAVGVIWARITIEAERGTPPPRTRALIRSRPPGRRRGPARARGGAERRARAGVRGVERPYLLNVGALHAGDWPSTTPGRAQLDVRLGLPIRLDPAAGQERLTAAVRATAPTRASSSAASGRVATPSRRRRSSTFSAAATRRCTGGDRGPSPPGRRPTCASSPRPRARPGGLLRADRRRPARRRRVGRPRLDRRCSHGSRPPCAAGASPASTRLATRYPGV